MDKWCLNCSKTHPSILLFMLDIVESMQTIISRAMSCILLDFWRYWNIKLIDWSLHTKHNCSCTLWCILVLELIFLPNLLRWCNWLKMF